MTYKTASLDSFNRVVTSVAHSFDGLYTGGVHRPDYFRLQLVDPSSGSAPFEPSIATPAMRTLGGLYYSLQHERKPIAFRGYRGMGKTHVLETLREENHVRNSKEPVGALVAIVDAKELYEALNDKPSDQDVVARFVSCMIEALFKALKHKAEHRIRGKKSYLNTIYVKLLSLAALEPNEKVRLDEEQLQKSLLDIVRSASSTVSGESLAKTVDKESLTVASAMVKDAVASKPQGADWHNRPRVFTRLLEYLATTIKTSTGIEEIIICIDDLSELPIVNRRTIERYLIGEFLRYSFAQDGTIKFRMAFYPTETYGPRKWQQKLVAFGSMEPFADLVLSGDDPVSEASATLRDRYFLPILEQRFRFAGDGVWPKVFGEGKSFHDCLMALGAACSGQPRRLGSVLRVASGLAFARAQSDAKAYIITESDVKAASIMLYESYEAGGGGTDMFPETITGLTADFGVIQTEEEAEIAKLLEALWGELSSPSLLDRIREVSGLNPPVLSSFVAKRSHEELLAPLINTGHVMKRFQFLPSVDGGATYTMYSLNYGFSCRERRTWDVQLAPATSRNHLESFALASSVVVGDLLVSLSTSLAKVG